MVLNLLTFIAGVLFVLVVLSAWLPIPHTTPLLASGLLCWMLSGHPVWHRIAAAP